MSLEEKRYRQQIASTIITQMGGIGKLRAMVGAHNFLSLEYGLQFRFKGTRKANTCKVIYNPGSDLYYFELWQVYIKSCKVKKVYSLDDVYSDMLIPLFEDYTGLYLSL